jgi:outer membrane murein-binding lipoprotein Lpp
MDDEQRRRGAFLNKFVLKRVVVWLVLGLVGGAVLADLVWRPRAASLNHQVADLAARAETQERRADQLESRVRAAEAEAKQLSDQLKDERELRHRYEDVLSKGRK